jgi:hydrogenase-4 component B
MSLILAGICLIFAGGIAQFFTAEKNKAMVVTFFTGLGAILVIAVSAGVLISGKAVQHVFFAGEISMDGLSAFFAVVIALASFCAVFYSITYMRMYEGKGMNFASHFFFLPVLIASMLAVTISRDAVVFLFSWEIMALSSFFLVIFENEKKDVIDAGIYYLVMSHISVALLMTGFALAGNMGLSFDSIAAAIQLLPGTAMAVFIVMFAGFAIKAGIVPLHTWLPAAHPAAPSHISALMSGVMIKLGIYGMARLIILMPETAAKASYAVLAAGLISALLGILYSLAQRDFKRVLAYSSIENMGIITAGMGLGLIGMQTGKPYMAMLGFSGAFMHVFNHSIFKSLLFFGAGSVYQKTHTRDMEHLGGLAKKMPVTAAAFLTGSAAVSGLPPLNGFAGEFFIYLAMIEAVRAGSSGAGAAGVLSLAALGLTGAIAVICLTRVYGIVFSGTARNEKADVEKGEDKLQAGLLAGMALLCLVCGIFPQVVFKPAFSAASCIGNFAPAAAAGQLNRLSVIFLIISATAVLLLVIKSAIMKSTVKTGSTWGCAYQDTTPKMQYTAYSYAESFLKLAEPMTGKQKEEIRARGFFPKQVAYKSKYFDMIEKALIKPLGEVSVKILKMFSWIQNGNMQRYILYGIIFLLLSIVWVLGGGK